MDSDRAQRVREAQAMVQRAPDDVPARLELGAALFDAHDPAGALEQFAAVLGRDPANMPALQGAAQSAVAVGDVARASGYLRLLAALSGVSADPSPTAPPPPFADRPPALPPADDRQESAWPNEREEPALVRDQDWDEADDEGTDEAP